MNIKAELTSVFRTIFDQEKMEIFDEMTAADVDGWDSITHISLVIAIEDHFGVRLSAVEVADLKNVGEMVELLKAKNVAG